MPPCIIDSTWLHHRDKLYWMLWVYHLSQRCLWDMKYHHELCVGCIAQYISQPISSWWPLPESSCCSLTYNACINNLHGMIFRHIDNVYVAISADESANDISHINGGIATIYINNKYTLTRLVFGREHSGRTRAIPYIILYLLMSDVRASSLKFDIRSVKKMEDCIRKIVLQSPALSHS